MDDKIYPFSSGSQYTEWEETNCARCTKGDMEGPGTCPIQIAVFVAAFEDGSVSEDIADRMGYLENNPPKTSKCSYIWPCKEFEEGPQ